MTVLFASFTNFEVTRLGSSPARCSSGQPNLPSHPAHPRVATGNAALPHLSCLRLEPAASRRRAGNGREDAIRAFGWKLPSRKISSHK
jgi:hypothetical protein